MNFLWKLVQRHHVKNKEISRSFPLPTRP